MLSKIEVENIWRIDYVRLEDIKKYITTLDKIYLLEKNHNVSNLEYRLIVNEMISSLYDEKN